MKNSRSRCVKLNFFFHQAFIVGWKLIRFLNRNAKKKTGSRTETLIKCTHVSACGEQRHSSETFIYT